MTSLLQFCLDGIYPPRCALCGNIITPKGHLVCSDCALKVKLIEEPRCKCCSKPVESQEQEFCMDCAKRERTWFERGFALWHYSTVMQQSIAQFKYHHRKEYVRFYADSFVRAYGDMILALDLDGLVPVPVHWTRYIQRGYNQAEVLARAIGRELDIPVYADLLVRNKKTVAQKQLDSHQRSANLEGAFSFSHQWGNRTNGINKIMIIDDIYTTGATMNFCAKVLRQAGIDQVYFGVLCIGAGY